MSYESGQTTAAISGTVSSSSLMPSGATLVIRSAQQAGAGSTTAYTVTAGKTLYITAVYSNARCSTANGGYIRIEADVLGDGNYRTLSSVTITSTATGFSQVAASSPMGIYVPVPATKIVRVTGDSANVNGEGGFIGYEI